MDTRELRVEIESDPVVFELGDDGGSDRREVTLKIWGATGRAGELSVEAGPAPDAGEFRFAVAAAEISDTSDDPEEAILARIPVTCSGSGGEEAWSSLEVRVTFGSGPRWVHQVALVASANHVLPAWQALREEYAALKPGWKDELDADAVLNDPAKSSGEKLAALFAVAHRRSAAGDGLVGLSLSGGGIRSATFNMGVLQGLANAGVLEKADYLSSVSGGGYIASWLSGWIHRNGGLANILAEVRGTRHDPEHPEPVQVTHLRQYSNYLTPKLGFLSADTWSAVAIVVRNLLLNLLVLVPVLAAVLALPLIAISKPQWIGDLIPNPDWLYWAAVLLTGTALFFMSLLRASVRPLRAPGGPPPPPPPAFLKLGLLPLLAAVPLILIAVHWYGSRRPGHALLTDQVITRCLIWSVLVPMVSLAASVLAQRRWMGRRRSSLVIDLLALLFSGLIEAAIYVGILEGWLPYLLDAPHHLYQILGPGLILGPMLLGKTLFIAFSSIAEGGIRYPSELGDADREWWARWSGWVLLTALLWIAAGALVYLGPFLLHAAWAKVTTAVAAGGLGGLVSLLGKSPGTPAARDQEQDQAQGIPWKGIVMALAAPLFCVALLLLVSAGTQAILWRLPVAWTGAEGGGTDPFRGFTLFLAGTVAVLFVAGVLMGRFVNVNRFSLQAIYRNRLVRAYLGASNRRRQPNLFTGFDPNDNLRLHALRANRPLPVINMALNLVAGEDLAWQQRKAESFTATPLHCGSFRLGYRRSQLYGGERGISLGTAVATSGAAANPNMGSSSSPAIAFIMTIFNARLGIWLGNPGPLGARTYTRGGPVNSAALILDEALGFTDSRHPYVNLSDGGHFENLGIYELVRRRCRFIVVGDAGCDPIYAYNDLGNAIRKIRIDFGISIEFDKRIQIFPKDLGKVNPAARHSAVGTIHYSDVDGAGAQDGVLIYIKPAICETESYDIYNYARSSPAFPHESTANQWFSESQFESYRALGRESIFTMVRHGPHHELPLSLADFQENVENYIRGGVGGGA
jgi:Patatin-like phospholipase